MPQVRPKLYVYHSHAIYTTSILLVYIYGCQSDRRMPHLRPKLRVHFRGNLVIQRTRTLFCLFMFHTGFTDALRYEVAPKGVHVAQVMRPTNTHPPASKGGGVIRLKIPQVSPPKWGVMRPTNTQPPSLKGVHLPPPP
jgi:hypothetical protein